jgi:hypothetical protein
MPGKTKEKNAAIAAMSAALPKDSLGTDRPVRQRTDDREVRQRGHRGVQVGSDDIGVSNRPRQRISQEVIDRLDSFAGSDLLVDSEPDWQRINF